MALYVKPINLIVVSISPGQAPYCV